MQPKTYYLAKW